MRGGQTRRVLTWACFGCGGNRDAGAYKFPPTNRLEPGNSPCCANAVREWEGRLTFAMTSVKSRPLAWRRFSSVALAVLFIAMIGTGPASAIVGSGSWTGHAPGEPSGAYGYADWNGSSNSVLLTAAGGSLGSGSCETTYFDWGVPSGHFDARASRDCRAGATASRTWADASAVTGMQKLGVCYATVNTMGSCAEHPQREVSISTIPPAFNSTNCTVSWFIRYSTGATTYYNGGSATVAAC